MNEFTNAELSHLNNALRTAISRCQENLPIWKKIAEDNPSAIECVKMTESEISNYSALIEKIKSIRGF